MEYGVHHSLTFQEQKFSMGVSVSSSFLVQTLHCSKGNEEVPARPGESGLEWESGSKLSQGISQHARNVRCRCWFLPDMPVLEWKSPC